MATTPDNDLVVFLDAQVGALTDGTNLFRGKMRAKGGSVPSSCVFCLATGGAPPMAFIGGGGVNLMRSTVQILVRSEQGKFEEGQTLARSVRDAVHQGVVSGYIGVKVNESEPNQLYEESSKHYIWTINVEMIHEQ